MKVIITGKNGYIAKNTYRLFRERNIDAALISVRDGVGNIDFRGVDVIIHCAGLVHKKYEESQYYRVNRDLTVSLAQCAKSNGVKKFIFLSTISVFGINSGVINKDTREEPVSFYGKSKLDAENKLKELECGDFAVVIVRPPMVYGKECSGNYSRLAWLAVRAPFFFDSKNERSMVYIENLAQFLYNAAVKNYRGTFYPQNREYVNTFQMVKKIRKCRGRKIVKLPFGGVLRGLKAGAFEKVFGSLVIDRELEKSNFDYCVCGFEESIERTEK